MSRFPRTSTLSLASLLFAGGPALAQDAPSEASRKLSDVPELAGLGARWRAALEGLDVPGCAVAVVRDGEVLAVEGFGVRNPEGDPVDGDTLFYVASCTKTFTAAALAVLAGRGRLSLDDPVRAHLARFALADDEASAKITVRDLLCHRPGLSSFPIVFLDAYTGQITEDRFYRWLRDVAPSGRVEYSNLHFTTAGRVLEALTGKSWKDAVEDLVFEPCGMDRTTAYAGRMYADPNVALPMERVGGTFAPCATRKSDSTMHAAGGAGTTARDAARWLLVQLREGELGGGRAMSAETARLLRTRQSDSPARGSIRRLDGFGLGWMLGTYRGRPYATHGGGYVGTAAHFSFLPEHGVGVVVLANASPGGQALCDVASIDVYDRLLGEEGHADLLPGYVSRMAGERGEAAAEPADGLVAGGELSLAPARYAGTYSEKDWGDFRIELEEGELVAHVGELPVVLRPNGKDRFLTHAAGDAIECSFLVDGDDVAAVILESDDGPVYFEPGLRADPDPAGPGTARQEEPPKDPVRERLEGSPRHHEWIDVRRGERTVRAFVAYPEVEGKALCVLVIHENKGLSDWVRSVADELAEAGYLAVAPDLLSGSGRATADHESTDDARRALYELADDDVAADLAAVAAHARKLAACTGKLAVAGFCWGGSKAFDFAVRSDPAAAFVFYGSAPDPGRLAKIGCPVHGFYGERDARITAAVEGTAAAMKAASRTYVPVVYPGAGHGFMRRGGEVDAGDADKAARAAAWKRWKELLAALSSE